MRLSGICVYKHEATASLDKETANHVANAILDLDGLTRIVVTHALDASQLRRYDCILTMKNGRLEEMAPPSCRLGSHHFIFLYTLVSNGRSTLLSPPSP